MDFNYFFDKALRFLIMRGFVIKPMANRTITGATIAFFVFISV
jgi:hypothetical protein